MTLARTDALVWVAIYLGLMLLGLGLALRNSGDSTLTWTVVGLGVALIGFGLLLIWRRSRTKESSR